jgi:hypothetical protein
MKEWKVDEIEGWREEEREACRDGEMERAIELSCRSVYAYRAVSLLTCTNEERERG